MIGAALLDLCARHGVTLTLDGNGFRAHGPEAARRRLKPLVLAHKQEVMAALAEAMRPGARPPMPPDGPGGEWHRDWKGRPCNLAGPRKGAADVN